MGDKENLVEIEDEVEEVEVIKPVTPKPRYKKRPANADADILKAFVESGPDKEDIQMFKLALGRLKGEEDSLTMDVCWAHYPHNILFIEQ